MSFLPYISGGPQAVLPFLLSPVRSDVHNSGVMPVVYPAVPKGAERLRMNVTCDHQREDLDYAIHALVRARAVVEAVTLKKLSHVV